MKTTPIAVVLRLSEFLLFLSCFSIAPCWPQTTTDFQKCEANYTTNSDLAIQYCTAAIQQYRSLSERDLAWAFFDRGRAYLDKHDYDRSIADYTSSIGLDPTDSMSFYNRGLGYDKKGDDDRAIADFGSAIGLKPDFTGAYFRRGNSFNHKGDYDQAIQDFSQAVRLNPNDANNFFYRASAYEGKGDFDHAISDYTESIRLNPRADQAFSRRGDDFDMKGEYGRALPDFAQALRLNPDLTICVYHAAWTHFLLGQYDFARIDFAAYLELSPEDLPTAVMAYVAQARAGKDAKGDLQKSTAALDLKPWPGKTVALYLGNATNETVLASATDPDPANENAKLCVTYFHLGEHALLAGNRAEAAQFFQKSLDTGFHSLEYLAAKEELRHLKP